MTSARAGRVISVGGGKGAGKSMVATNLAVALAQAGARVVLVDAEVFAPSLHGLLGVPRPPPAALPPGAPASLDAAAVETGVPGLRLVALGGAAASDGPRLQRALRAIDAEVVVLDVGAGEPSEVLERLDAADLRLLVTTPDLSSATDVYALLTGSARRELLRGAAALGQQARVEAALERAGAGAGTAQILAGLAIDDPALAAALRARMAGFGARIVGNLLLSIRETGLVYALARMAREFLGVEAPVLVSLRASRRLQQAAVTGLPYLSSQGADGEDVAAALRTIAQTLRVAPLARAGAAGSDEAASVAPSRPLALPAALPVDIAAYEAGYQRHLVELPVTLVHAGGELPALLMDVSEGGALCDLDAPPQAGTQLTLLVPGLDEPAGLACEVRHAAPGKRRAGLQFQLGREEGRRVALAIRMLGADRLRGVPGVEGLVR